MSNSKAVNIRNLCYKTCPFCGDHLDFGERCRCQEDKPLHTKKETAPDGVNIEGMLCKAFLDTCMGKPLLSIEKEEFYGPATSRVVHGLNVDDLARRGMVEEIVTAAERNRRR